MIINLFCDASIDLNRKIACSGCYITSHSYDMGVPSNFIDMGRRLMIQTDATNNSSEILAIWLGVREAIRLRRIYPGAVFRLFSDSKISLYGLRDWMKNWVKNIDSNGILISSSGAPVMNQQKFIEIYNMIIENNLKIELYHNRGHAGGGGKVSLKDARIQFIKANKVPPEGLGLTIEYISNYNSLVDNATREAVRAYDSYLKTGFPSDVEVEGIYPMEFIVRASQCHQYIRCIDKTSVRSRHDFKGGYNQ